MARAFLALALATLLSACAAQSGTGGPAGPPAVALADTAAGNQLFHGLGDCSDCHGEGGVGTSDGPPLVSGTWKLGDGSYEWLLQMTRHAGWGVRDRGGDPQAMRGPTVLDSVQVSQVARYVYAISRDRKSRSEPGGP
jgi:mono/diheme cytochrome c family protein